MEMPVYTGQFSKLPLKSHSFFVDVHLALRRHLTATSKAPNVHQMMAQRLSVCFTSLQTVIECESNETCKCGRDEY